MTGVERLEDRSLLSVATWDGGGSDNNWTTDENWVGDVAPVAGDDLVFPVSPSQKTNVNDFGAGFDFGSILIAGSNYNLSGNAIDLFGSVTSNGTGNTFGVPVQLGSAGGFANTATSTFTVTSAIDLHGQALSVNTASSLGTTVLSGAISETGNVIGSVSTGGSGVTALAGESDYSGLTTVTSGTLAVRHAEALGTTVGGTSVTGSSATLRLENGITVAGESLSSPSNVYFFLASQGTGLTNVWTGNVAAGTSFEIRPSSGNTLRLDGTVSTNNGGLYQTTSGTVAFHGSFLNVYQLGVNSGTFEANANLATTYRPEIYGTLGGTGTLTWTSTSPAYVVGTINPGTNSSTGILNLGDIAYQPSSSNNFTVLLNGLAEGTQHDQLNVTGTVVLAGNLNVSLGVGYTPNVGDTFTILNNDGSDPINTTFNGLPDGGLVNYGGNIFQINYFGGVNSNDIVLTALAINHFPTGAAQSVTTNEEVPLGVTLTGNDLDGDAITFSIVTAPTHGTLTGSGANRTYTRRSIISIAS